MQRLLFILLLCLLPARVCAQDFQDSRYSLAISASGKSGSISDEQYSPLIYNTGGFGVDLLLHMSRQPSKYYQEVRFNYSMGLMNYGEHNHFTSTYYDVAIDYNWMWRLFRKSQVVGFYLGVMGQVGGNGIFLDTDASAYSYLINYSLMPQARLILNLGPVKLSSQFSTPLLSYVCRPPRNGYSANTTETVAQAVFNALLDGTFSGPTKYSCLNWKSGIIVNITPNFAIGADYIFMLEKFSETQKSFADLSNIININIAITL